MLQMWVTLGQLCQRIMVKNYFYFREITDQMKIMNPGGLYKMAALFTKHNPYSKSKATVKDKLYWVHIESYLEGCQYRGRSVISRRNFKSMEVEKVSSLHNQKSHSSL